MALNRKLTASALAIGFACALSGMVLAADGALPLQTHNLTRAEAQADAAKLFDRLDANHDGKLDAADRSAQVDARRDVMFDRLDTNHDGMVSRAEFHAAPRRDAMDGDHWRGRGEGRGRGEHRGLMLAGLILHRADPNHTGTVTRDGFTGAALALFDEADTNHDGVVTGEERAAELGRLGYRRHEMMRARWAEHPGADATKPPAA